MAAPRQEPVSLEVRGTPLRGMCYAPAADARRGLVVCDPFAEEKKSAESTLGALCRALAEAGLWVWHFDYRGTGDSGGEFERFGLADWRADLAAAAGFARGECGVPEVGLLGLRLGGTLAAQLAPEVAPACVVLWEPLREGARYLREIRQRSTIKSMLTQAEGAGLSAETVPEADGLDMGGYLLTPELLEELSALRLTALADVAAPLLLVECNARGEVSEPGRALLAGAPRAEARALVLEPFWQRVGLVDTGPLVRETVEWLSRPWGIS